MELKRDVIILILLQVKWYNFWNTEHYFTKFSEILGFCWKMIFTKYHDEEVNEKRALLVSCVLRYNNVDSIL